mmetsp:Transcript_19534/g.57889  ORF Transcript_19534/g.57889 Transcript_19534/m.57889 type:complete len:240 (-) Transcript_19534:66-785(-)
MSCKQAPISLPYMCVHKRIDMALLVMLVLLLYGPSPASAFTCHSCAYCNYNGCSNCYYANGEYCSNLGSCTVCDPASCGPTYCSGCSQFTCSNWRNQAGIGCAMAFSITGLVLIGVCLWFSVKKSREQQQFNVQMTPMPPAATANPAHHLSTHSSRYACMPTDIHGQMQHGQPAYGQPATGYPAYTTTYRANAPAGFLPQGYPTASMSGMPPGTNAYPSIPAANLSRTASDVPMLSAKQ